MTDLPILFSAPMVRALLDGRKQQTRRILQLGTMLDPMPEVWEAKEIDGDWYFVSDNPACDGRQKVPVRFRKGDRLWVRENLWLYGRWRQEGTTPKGRPRQTLDLIGKVAAFEKPADIAYWGGKAGFAFRPGIHMPRWASRLTLTVTDVRVQRLQECSGEDAIAEGITGDAEAGRLCRGVDAKGDVITSSPQDAYRLLWEAINGAGSWDANPWIVALTFTVERQNIDAMPLAYLIWSNVHGAWWGPNRAGYYTELSLAGRYTREEAIKQCAYGRDGFTAHRTPSELPVREIDAINRCDRRVEDLVLKADRAECRARDLASKARAA